MEKQPTVDEKIETIDSDNYLVYFDSVCDVKGHLFGIEPDKDILPKQPKDDLFKWCFVCDGHVKFWKYSPDMVQAIEKSKVMCC